ncbi:MAG: molybdenum cofactor biosynthesis protein MoaE [Pirellulaceae bacterium]
MSDANDASALVKLVDEPIDIVAISETLSDYESGAHSLFLGTTRRTTQSRQTEYLVYDAYRPMAKSELSRLAGEAFERWSLKRLVIVHRLGRVDLGEASIAIGASAPHRKAVFESIPWLMDQIKSCVPIWKQENWSDGTSEWVHP